MTYVRLPRGLKRLLATIKLCGGHPELKAISCMVKEWLPLTRWRARVLRIALEIKLGTARKVTASMITVPAFNDRGTHLKDKVWRALEDEMGWGCRKVGEA